MRRGETTIVGQLGRLLELGHRVMFEDIGHGFEVTVYAADRSHDHEHYSGETISEAMNRAYNRTLEDRPPQAKNGDGT